MPSTPAGSSGSPLSLEELADLLGARIKGEPRREIHGVAALSEAGEGDLTFLGHPRYRELLSETGASAALVPEDADASPTPTCSLLRVGDVYLALAQVLEHFHPVESPEPGIREGAQVHETARLGNDCAAFPGSHVGAGAVLGDRVVLHPGSVVGDECRLGDDVVLYPNVVIYPGTELGNRVVVHAGSVLGSDGFGYTPGPEGLKKVLQVGRLVVEDDVEIGAQCALDRGSLGETRIGRGTKIDNLCHVAHNVRIGPHSILVGQSGIAGSTTLESGVVVAGQSGVAGHLKLGAGARVAAKSAVFQDVEGGETVAGIPAIGLTQWRRSVSAFAKLPEILRRLRRLERSRGEDGNHENKGE